jgi:hypothetical protein
MATPGQLSRTVARLLGLSEPTVLVHDRNLAAAGLRTTTGGRGRSAAKMTPADAAALLIASVASPSLRDTVETFRNYSGLIPQRGLLNIISNKEVVAKELLGQTWDLRFMPVPSITSLSSDHTFFEFLTAVIAATVASELKLARPEDHRTHAHSADTPSPPDLYFRLIVPDTSAEVSIMTKHFEERRAYFYIHPDHVDSTRPKPTKIDLRSDYTFTDRTIYAIGKLLGETDQRGKG